MQNTTEFKYIVGFHDLGGYDELEMTFYNPVHVGENIIDDAEGAEWTVFRVTHETDFSTLHVKA